MNSRKIAGRWRSRLVERAIATLDRGLERLEERVRQNAPERTGELKDSVRKVDARLEGKRIKGAVVVSSDHALAVEYGTHDQLPEPYFRPAIESEVPGIKADVRRLSD